LPPDLAGRVWESHRILKENTGNIWNMEAVFPPGIFQNFFDDFRTDPVGKHENLSESSGKIPDQNIASNFLVFSVVSRLFPAVRGSPENAPSKINNFNTFEAIQFCTFNAHSLAVTMRTL
jgi:hypothetical protein